MTEQDDDVKFRPNLTRRVENFALGSNASGNVFVPLHEAIYNALHAIADRFGDQWSLSGKINIALIDLGTSSPSIEIRDNGVGLTKDNFDSFRTYDSPRKVAIGGKGVGRLSWLKVFHHADVVSHYYDDDKLYRRSFRLALDNDQPIQLYSHTAVESGEIGTIIKLVSLRNAYIRHMPTQAIPIVRRLVSHFMPYLVAGAVPSIYVETEDQTIDLTEFLKEKEIKYGSGIIDNLDRLNFKIDHSLLNQEIVEGKIAHRLHFAAHNRVVLDFDVGLPLGLTTAVERDGAKYVYAGVVTSPILDATVNSERTAFDIDDQDIEAMKRASLTEIRKILSSQIDRVIQKQTDLMKSVVKKFPRFSYLIGDPRNFVENKIPRNFRTAEQLYQQLSVFDYRENRDIERKIEDISRKGNEEDIISAGVEQIIGKLTAQEFSVLADYTVRRKVVLDLLERRLGYRADGTMKHNAEEALHNFVVPMRATNTDVHIDKHNLWIIDDKLTYYEHWASDKKLKKLVMESDSDSRPDVLLFGGRTAYHRPGTDQPVVIIEFKKPARSDYSDDENPFTQIYSYIEDLRSGSVLDRDGGVIQEVGVDTPFFCYIIADLTPNMRRWLKLAQVNVPLPGGGGYYGYNSDYRAFIQALSYRYVLKDARLRNEAFFKQLNI